MPLEAKWIPSRLFATAGEINRALGEYRFHEAATTLYDFFWGDFCDWYLEIVKLRLDFSGPAAPAQAALATLVGVFERSLRLLSPFMPFLCEEVWHALYENHPSKKSIALATYPQDENGGKISPAEAQMKELQALIVAVRDMRRQVGVEEKVPVPIRLRSGSPARPVIEQNQDIVSRLGKVSGIEFVEGVPAGASVRSASSSGPQ